MVGSISVHVVVSAHRTNNKGSVYGDASFETKQLRSSSARIQICVTNGLVNDTRWYNGDVFVKRFSIASMLSTTMKLLFFFQSWGEMYQHFLSHIIHIHIQVAYSYHNHAWIRRLNFYYHVLKTSTFLCLRMVK